MNLKKLKIKFLKRINNRLKNEYNEKSTINIRDGIITNTN